MKWNWLRNKEVLEQLIVYWDNGTNNYAVYFTNPHLPTHHRQLRPRYIHTSNTVIKLSHRKIPQIIILWEGVLN